MKVRTLKIADYDKVYALWQTERMGLNNVDDSRGGMEQFLRQIQIHLLSRRLTAKLSERFFAEMTAEAATFTTPAFPVSIKIKKSAQGLLKGYLTL